MIHEGQQSSLLAIRQREEEAMTRAILAVLTAPSNVLSTSTSSSPKKVIPRASAFKRYSTGVSVSGASRLRKQINMTKRAIAFYRGLDVIRRERLDMGGSPTATQLHHMITERKRREKLNESFQALRLLLPPTTKKDKASLLEGAREQITRLQSEVSRLKERNRELGAEFVGEREMESLGKGQRLTVGIKRREKTAGLRVVVRGENVSVDDLIIRLIEFLKRVSNVSLVSIEARTLTQEGGDSSPLLLLSLGLMIEGEWDESALQEAVRRVIADVAD
ncbi:PREDICTED: putative transcription factor bHLH041 [Tarenaya hassleriana]|uniref:putative transcription factor bHLH041 n=1 Tax=Tarenaya hassleriana TaxID=28532 RepID=UPI00053C1928|nr:PREDICTED: putative transcription factor bHLH041 [Tarenaya hassleriana]